MHATHTKSPSKLALEWERLDEVSIAYKRSIGTFKSPLQGYQGSDFKANHEELGIHNIDEMHTVSGGY